MTFLLHKNKEYIEGNIEEFLPISEARDGDKNALKNFTG